MDRTRCGKGAMSRAPRKAVTGIVAAACVLLAPLTAYGEPHLAIREGFLCSQCHTNRTGGGKRNAFGLLYTQTVLPVWKLHPPRDDGLPGGSGGWFLDARLGEAVTVGADFRLQNVTLLETRGAFQGEELIAKGANTFKIPEGNLYLEIELARDRVLLYLDETVAPESAASREAFLLVHEPRLRAYLKAGRFLLPYGLRLADDTSFVREVTGFNYGNQDLGVEGGAEPGPVFLYVAVTNGTQGGVDTNRSKQLTATAGVHDRSFRWGLSYSWNDGSTEKAVSTRQALALFAAASAGRLSLSAEVDTVRDGEGAPDTGAPSPEERRQIAAYVAADLLVRRGLNLRLGYELADPDVEVPEDERDRFTIGADAFLLPFLRLSAVYHLRRDIPQKVSGNQDTLIVQVHALL